MADMEDVEHVGNSVIIKLCPKEVGEWIRDDKQLGSDGFAAVFFASRKGDVTTRDWVIKYVMKFPTGTVKSRDTAEYVNLAVENEVYKDLRDKRCKGYGIHFPTLGQEMTACVGTDGATEMAYIVVSRVRGMTVNDWARTRSVRERWPGDRMPPELVYEFGFAALNAFWHLHACGWVQRDVKFMNMMVIEEDTGELKVVLIDFGTSIRMDDPKPQQVAGNMLFRSIASHNTKPSDPLDDLESLGYVMAHLARGKNTLPWKNVHEYDLLYAVQDAKASEMLDRPHTGNLDHLVQYLRFVRANNPSRDSNLEVQKMGYRSNRLLSEEREHKLESFYAKLRGYLADGLAQAKGRRERTAPVAAKLNVMNLTRTGSMAVVGIIINNGKVTYLSSAQFNAMRDRDPSERVIDNMLLSHEAET